ncbi:MAG: CPBP family glutamic-type intramembrane protease [Candidatus Hodarchaeales archaeon]
MTELIVILPVSIAFLTLLMGIIRFIATPLHVSDVTEYNKNPAYFFLRFSCFSPVFEEFLFRMFLMDVYLYSGLKIDVISSSVISSFIFAMIHLLYVFEERFSVRGLIIEMIVLTIGGITLAVVYWQAGIMGAISCHFIVNLFEILFISKDKRFQTSIGGKQPGVKQEVTRGK